MPMVKGMFLDRFVNSILSQFIEFRFTVNDSSEQLIRTDEEVTDSDYDPFTHREVEHPLT